MIPPPACGVAFKEWAGICQALADGRQTLLLRKGGISEGPGGFRPEHDAFWLFPTHLHQGEQGLRVPTSGPRDAGPGQVALDLLAIVASLWFIDRAETLDALAEFHVWTAETVRQRFAYRRPGLWALAVRVYRLPDPHRIEDRLEYAGCKTWVPLAEPLSTRGVSPILGDDEFARTLECLGARLPGTTLRDGRDDG